MGQYWLPIMEKNNVRKFICAHYWDNGYKFMESSWVGNDVPSLVMYKIYKDPMKVSWVGDYCDKPIGTDGPIGETLWTQKEQEKMLCLVNYDVMPEYMRKDGKVTLEDYEKPEEVSAEEVRNFRKMFNETNIVKYNLVNHTKKEYLSLREYMRILRYNGVKWLMHPLPVLTAAPSMDYGMGDYHESRATNWEQVGVWSWDEVSVEDEKDFETDNDKFKDYEKLYTEDYVFEERRG